MSSITQKKIVHYSKIIVFIIALKYSQRTNQFLIQFFSTQSHSASNSSSSDINSKHTDTQNFALHSVGKGLQNEK